MELSAWPTSQIVSLTSSELPIFRWSWSEGVIRQTSWEFRGMRIDPKETKRYHTGLSLRTLELIGKIVLAQHWLAH